MKSFINVQDIGPLDKAMAEAFEIKNDRFKYQHLGRNKTLMMIFFNNSLRTRLSTQKAAMNLGMNVIVLDVNAGAWKRRAVCSFCVMMASLWPEPCWSICANASSSDATVRMAIL